MIVTLPLSVPVGYRRIRLRHLHRHPNSLHRLRRIPSSRDEEQDHRGNYRTIQEVERTGIQQEDTNERTRFRNTFVGIERDSKSKKVLHTIEEKKQSLKYPYGTLKV